MRPDRGVDRTRRQYGGRLTTLGRRVEFQRLRGGVRWSGAGFLMEGKPRDAGSDIAGARFGFTITKKIGKAHERNRIRRRLSHALRSVQIPAALRFWDCVIVARRGAIEQPFDRLVEDFRSALVRLSRSPAAPVKAIPKPPRIAEP